MTSVTLVGSVKWPSGRRASFDADTWRPGAELTAVGATPADHAERGPRRKNVDGGLLLQASRLARLRCLSWAEVFILLARVGRRPHLAVIRAHRRRLWCWARDRLAAAESHSTARWRPARAPARPPGRGPPSPASIERVYGAGARIAVYTVDVARVPRLACEGGSGAWFRRALVVSNGASNAGLTRLAQLAGHTWRRSGNWRPHDPHRRPVHRPAPGRTTGR